MGCKWSSLNAPGIGNPQSHPVLELENCPFLWRLLFDMNARTLSPYLTKPPDSLFTDHLNEKMDMEIDSPSSQNIKGRKCIFKVINEVKVPTSEILKFPLSS